MTAALVDVRSLHVLPGSTQRYEVDSGASADAILDVWALAASGAAEWVAAHAERAEQAGDTELLTLDACGFAMPDPFDYANGVALFTGVGKFESLYGVDVRAALLDRTGFARVDFLNDADAFALGEWVSGAAVGTSRCAAITLGTGIGSGWIADGHPVSSGDAVPDGGRAHRLRVDGVPLEELVSRRAIRRDYAAATGGPTGDIAVDVREICDWARGGQDAARNILHSAFHTLGAALGPSFARFEPEVVVVGGSMAASWDLFEPSVVEGMAPAVAPRFVVTASAEAAALVGAARHALG